MKEIRLGIGFATGRKSFKRVLAAYINTWNVTKQNLPDDLEVKLSLFVSYDLEYFKTQSTDFTNLSQEVVDTFERIVFMGARNALASMEGLKRSEALTESELKSVFGTGYAGKRNAVVYAAIENRMDYLLFLDDDEYPMAVTNNHGVCLWSGQRVFLEHLQEIGNADITNGYHCGYVSPIPQMRFNETLSEEVFRQFIEAISNDIITWKRIRTLMDSGGVTYASTDVLRRGKTAEVEEIGKCKFISGSNLCLNLTQPGRTLPFFNPPGARGEDTFLSTLLSDRVVRKIPCYTFHDGFSIYHHLLGGVLPLCLTAITADSPAVANRFFYACVGWVRYKPLLVYLTQPDKFEHKMKTIRASLEKTLPAMTDYFNDKRFNSILGEFDKYHKQAPRHSRQFQLTQKAWAKIVAILVPDDPSACE